MDKNEDAIYGLVGIAKEHQKTVEQQQKQINQLTETIPQAIQQNLDHLRTEHQRITQDQKKLLDQFNQKASHILDWRYLLYTGLACLLLFLVASIGFYQYAGYYAGKAAEAKATYNRFKSLNAAYLGKCLDDDGSHVDCVSVDLEQGRWVVDGNEVRAIKKQ